jgi:hypothetical protein
MWKHVASQVKTALQTRNTQNCHKSRSHTKILDAKDITWSTLHDEGPQTIRATVQNLAQDLCNPSLKVHYVESHKDYKIYTF